MKENLKVENLKIRNIMKIKEVSICPKSEIVLIAGANAVGKTSVIKSLEIAFKGRKAMAGITKIVNDKEKEGDIIADFDEIVIKRHFTDDGKEELKVLRKDGTKIKKTPQGVLDAMYNKMLKPYAFKEMSPKEQKTMLINSLSLDIDLPKLEEKRQKIYDLRTVKGHDRDNAKAHLENIEPPGKDLPKKTISISDLSRKLEDAKDWNDRLIFNNENIIENLKAIEIFKSEIKKLNKDIKELEDNTKKIKEEIKDKKLKNLDAIREEISEAESINEEVRTSEKRGEFYKEFKKSDAEYNKFTEEIQAIDKRVEEALVKANMPIPGLEIYEDGLGIDGLPFAQLAESDQLKAAIGISMGLEPQPQIKVLIIENGRDLDSKNWEIVREMAKKNKYQIWVQYLDESGEVGFIMKEGYVEKIGREI